MTRSTLVASVPLRTITVMFVLTSCVGSAPPDDPHHGDSDRPPWFGLEGEALERELAESPPRRAPVPFARLGVVWDADAPGAIELATSADGVAWSAWHPPDIAGHEVEGSTTGAAFVGAVAAEPGATFYRIRGGAGRAYFVGLEFLELGLDDAIEDGDPPDDASQDYLAAAAMIQSRASWGARAPRCTSPHTPARFTIHHTVTPTTDTLSPEARLRNIQAYHQDVRGWCDIGYQYLISRDGRVWEGRGAAKVGSHVAGQNTGNVGIAFLGTYTSVSATATQVANAGALVGDLAARYGIARTNATIKGHRDRGETSCPGDRLYGQLGSIIAGAQNGGLVPPPAAEPTTVKGIVYAGTDTSKRIAGATITLGDRTTTTSASGYYELADVGAASFEVTARAPGFAAHTIQRSVAGPETWASVSLAPAREVR